MAVAETLRSADVVSDATEDASRLSDPPPTEYVENEDVPGHLVRRLAQAFTTSVTERIAAFGITRPQYVVLTFIYRHPDTDQATLSRRQSIDEPTTAEIIRRLMVKGLVDRRRNQIDRRANMLRLTDEGRRIAETCLPLARGAHEQCLSNLSANERTEFLRLVSKILDVENIYYGKA